MIKQQVNRESILEFIAEITKELDADPLILVTTEVQGKIGKWGMAKLWRAWIGEVSKFMAANGVTMPLMINSEGKPYGTRPFNSQDCHELMTTRFLGLDGNGKRLSWAKNNHDDMVTADKSQRYHAMQRMDEWATERGIKLYRPQDSEYMEWEGRENQ